MNVERTTTGAWRFTWPVGTSPYQVWLDGILLDTVAVEEYTISDPRYTTVPPEIEVGDTPSSGVYPPFVRLQWRGNQAAIAYNIEQNIGAGWKTVATVKEDRQGYYTWQSRALEDGSAPQFRVTATDARANLGVALTFTMTVYRNPLAIPVSTLIVAGDLVIDEP